MKFSFFLDKTDLILNEINMSYIYHNEHILKLCNFCWDIGKITAISFNNHSILDIVAKNNITITKKKSLPLLDNIIFSSYNKINNNIIIYEETIKKYFTPYVPSNYNFNSYDLFIKHEFFHFLQCNNYYKLKPYKLNFLNEIAAYSFTNNFGIIN